MDLSEPEDAVLVQVQPYNKKYFISPDQLVNHYFLSADVSSSEPALDGYNVWSKCWAVYQASEHDVVPVIAFCGHTGSGKTRLLSQLIPKKDFEEGIRPHVHPPGSEGPETSDVSLFKGRSDVADFPCTWLLDCEGSNALKQGNMLRQLVSFWFPNQLVERIITPPDPARRVRVVDQVLPSLVYTFADIIVYVTLDRLFVSSTIKELYAFARRSARASNTPWKPVLIVVRNCCMASDLQTLKKSTEEFIKAVRDYDLLQNEDDFTLSDEDRQTRETQRTQMGSISSDIRISLLDLFAQVVAVTVQSSDETPYHEQLPDPVVARFTQAIKSSLDFIKKSPSAEARMNLKAFHMIKYIQRCCSIFRFGKLNFGNANEALMQVLLRVGDKRTGSALQFFRVLWSRVPVPKRTLAAFTSCRLLSIRYLLIMLATDFFHPITKREDICKSVKKAVEIFFSKTAGFMPCMAYFFHLKCTQDRLGHGNSHRNPHLFLLPFRSWSGSFDDRKPLPNTDVVKTVASIFATPAPPISGVELSHLGVQNTISSTPWHQLNPDQVIQAIILHKSMSSCLSQTALEIINHQQIANVLPMYTFTLPPGNSLLLDENTSFHNFIQEYFLFSLDVMRIQSSILSNHGSEEARMMADSVELKSRVRQIRDLTLSLKSTLIDIDKDSTTPEFLFCILCGEDRALSQLSCSHTICYDCHDSCSRLKLPCPVCAKEVAQQNITSGRILINSPHVRPRVLSLDGGGVRGLSTAVLLNLVESGVNSLLNSPAGFNIAEMFDLVGGTSAGGIITLGLALGISTTEIIKMFRQFGPEVFGENSAQSWLIYFSGKRTEQLRKLLQLGFGNRKLPRYPYAFVTATEVSSGFQMHLLTNYSFTRKARTATQSSEGVNVPPATTESSLASSSSSSMSSATETLVSDEQLDTQQELIYPIQNVIQAAEATAAAPQYFHSAEIENRIYQDGAIVANNPSLQAYHQVNRLWPVEPAVVTKSGTYPLSQVHDTPEGQIFPLGSPVGCHLSIGTGKPTDVKNDFGWFSYIEKAVEQLTNTEQVHKDCELQIDKGQYFRLNPGAGVGDTPLNEGNQTKLDSLLSAAQKYAQTNAKMFQELYTTLAAAMFTSTMRWDSNSPDKRQATFILSIRSRNSKISLESSKSSKYSIIVTQSSTRNGQPVVLKPVANSPANYYITQLVNSSSYINIVLQAKFDQVTFAKPISGCPFTFETTPPALDDIQG